MLLLFTFIIHYIERQLGWIFLCLIIGFCNQVTEKGCTLVQRNIIVKIETDLLRVSASSSFHLCTYGYVRISAPLRTSQLELSKSTHLR